MAKERIVQDGMAGRRGGGAQGSGRGQPKVPTVRQFLLGRKSTSEATKAYSNAKARGDRRGMKKASKDFNQNLKKKKGR